MSTQPISVLVVDDSEDHRLLMERSLTDAGMRVRTVATGNEALRSLDSVHLVLLDYKLPGMSGLDTLRAIRDQGGPSVVMVTGVGSELLAVEAMTAGAIDYLVKDPHYLKALPERISRAYRHHDLRRRAAELQRLALLVTSAVDSEQIFTEIVRGARILLGAQACGLCLVGVDGLDVVAVDGVGVGDPGDLISAAVRALSGPDAATPGRVLVRLPALDGKPMGVLAVIDEPAREFLPEEVTLAETFAAFAGLALQNLRRFQVERSLNLELEVRAGQQAAIVRLGQLALSGADVNDVIDEATSAVAEVLGVDSAQVFERIGVDPLASLVPVGALAEGAHVHVADWPQAMRTIQTGAPFVVEGSTSKLPEHLRARGLDAGVTVSIRSHDSVFGVLSAHASTPRMFTANDIDFLQSTANVIATAVDVRTARQTLSHQALHDPLTGLPNRALLFDRLQHALARASREEFTVAVLFLDIDRFKLVNDSLGHTVGDELLTAVAERLLDVVRPGDTVSRFGGDEFVVVCEHLPDEADAVALAERIGESLTVPVSVRGRAVPVSVSIGIVIADPDRDDAESLLRDADGAMYRAKERGRSGHEIFDETMRERAVARLETEADLRRAVQNGEMRLVYQPEISLETGSVVAVEALVRWMHPRRGLLAPAEFLPLAEETGLIIPIGQWVLAESCRQMQAYRAAGEGRDDVVLWVNLSARELIQPDLIAVVAAAMSDTSTDPRLLGIEITESVVVDEPEFVGAALSELRRLGVQLAVDDFGTGYSSLTSLRRFPVSVVKIDRSFVAGVVDDADDSSIVRAVVGLGHSLGLRVVAEGMESHAQLAALRSLGCDVAQGYYFGLPAPVGDWGPVWRGVDGDAVPHDRHLLDGKRVVICDDDAQARSVIRLALELEGAEVLEVADGDSCIVEAARSQPDLIVLDLLMPGRDGLSTLPELLRRSPGARVLIVTAFDDPNVSLVASRLGAMRCVDKAHFIGHLDQLVAT